MNAGDLNNDGLSDLYFTGNMVGDHLYYNRGQLKFQESTVSSGILQTNLWTTGVTMTDINGDGWLDIYVCRSGIGSFRNNLLYINQQNGKFVEKARAYGLNDSGYSVQANFFDYDLDGDLDMYLVNHSGRFFSDQLKLFERKNNPHPSEADRLYQNQGIIDSLGHPVFTDVSMDVGINHFGFGLSASIGDVNRDGWPDIYVANDFFEPDFLYINNGGESFKDSLQQFMGHTSFSSMGSDMADFNNDGWIDLAVCDMQAPDNFRKKANMASMDTERFARMLAEGYYYQYMQNTLQLNSGLGRFSEIAELAGVSETDWSWGPLFCDLDNDGWKDLFIANGVRRDIQYKDILLELAGQTSPQQTISVMDLVDKFPVHRLSNFTFSNRDGLNFEDVSEPWGINFAGFSTGTTYSDLDNDGDLDIILNNIDDVASIYENQSDQLENHQYLTIHLQGVNDNVDGIGATLEAHTPGKVQYHYVQTTRGFQSSTTDIHFGFPASAKTAEIVVRWPDRTITRLTDVDLNQAIEIEQHGAEVQQPTPGKPTIFHQMTPKGIDYTHLEKDYDDFAREVLLPHKYSQLGPCLATGDVDGNGLTDLFVGGGAGQSGQLFLQQVENDYQHTVAAFGRDDDFEDVDAALFDADGDGDLDLYVVSGSNQWPPSDLQYQDRLYLNDGSGAFKRERNALPEIDISGGCVRPGDVDGDGDLDLFIGGRIVPGQYPKPARSLLLINDAGTFSDQTGRFFGANFRPGLVTDATWSDLDENHGPDLVVVGEWMPIQIYLNQGDQLVLDTSTGLEKSHGWWYSLATGDFDGDGDTDLVAGNLGLNYKYRATETEPFQVFAADFDENQSLDIVLSYFDGGQLFPLRGRECSAEQLPILKERFPSYTDFASATVEDVYGKQDLMQAIHYQVETFASSYIENLGSDGFQIHPLPTPAQFSSVMTIIPLDINRDQHLDLLLGGNMFESEVETARNDASIGALLLGDGAGNFESVPPTTSGLLLAGNVKDMVMMGAGHAKELLIVANNNASLEVFEKSRMHP